MSEVTANISSALNGLEREFSIIAHNLANVSTAGYKRQCSTFAKHLMAQGLGENMDTGGEAELNTTFDFSQGSVAETGRSLDFALCGKGFFVIETPEGPLYTRNGMFRLNQNGQIVDSAGKIVAGEAGPITISLSDGSSQISVSGDGSVSAGGSEVGKFKLVDFKDNEGKLTAVGLNCFEAPKDVIPEPAANVIVKQGFQESSNVQLAEELVDMIMVSRLYEANTKFLAASKDASGSLINVAMG
jgi:flagellar basal-body rod protein FlgF